MFTTLNHTHKTNLHRMVSLNFSVECDSAAHEYASGLINVYECTRVSCTGWMFSVNGFWPWSMFVCFCTHTLTLGCRVCFHANASEGNRVFVYAHGRWGQGPKHLFSNIGLLLISMNTVHCCCITIPSQPIRSRLWSLSHTHHLPRVTKRQAEFNTLFFIEISFTITQH